MIEIGKKIEVSKFAKGANIEFKVKNSKFIDNVLGQQGIVRRIDEVRNDVYIIYFPQIKRELKIHIKGLLQNVENS